MLRATLIIVWDSERKTPLALLPAHNLRDANRIRGEIEGKYPPGAQIVYYREIDAFLVAAPGEMERRV